MLDHREIPAHIPIELKERITACRAIRANPKLLDLVEGLWIEKVTGNGSFIPSFKNFEGDVTQLLEISDRWGWCVSPFTVGLALSHRMGQKFSCAPHIRLLSNCLVAAYQGRGERTLLCSMPARNGKTHLLARFGALFFIFNNPWLPMIYCTATDTAADQVGRLVKTDLLLHQDFTGVAIAEDSRSSGRIDTVYGGSITSSGILTQILGLGAANLVIDDPAPSSEAWASPNKRNEIFDLWQGTLQPRMQSGAVCTVVMTRMHHEDLIGRLQNGWQDVKPIPCRYVRIPALCDDPATDPLHRELGQEIPTGPIAIDGFGYTKEDLEARRASTSQENWLCNYMQTPLSETGIGRVYAWSDNLVLECAFDDRLPVLVGVDLNVSPLAMVIGQAETLLGPLAHLSNRDIRTELHILAELVLENTNTFEASEALIQMLLNLVPQGRPTKVKLTADASSTARRTSSNTTDLEILKQAFKRVAHRLDVRFIVPNANPAVKDRTNRVNTLLKPAIGPSHVRIDPRCVELIADLKLVRWMKDKAGNSLATLDKRDSERTHVSDAFGYMVCNTLGNTPLQGTVGWKSAHPDIFLG